MWCRTLRRECGVCVRQEGRHLSDIIFRNWVINVSNQNCIYYRLFWCWHNFFILNINKVTIIWKTCVPFCATLYNKYMVLITQLFGYILETHVSSAQCRTHIKCRYIGTVLTDQHCMQKKVTCTSLSMAASDSSVQNLSPSRSLSKYIYIYIYILHLSAFVKYCETSCLT